ncbi:MULTISPECIES: hypothetical protein [Hyphomicrobiales]|nr:MULTISPECIES: hypothetical protein [Hyphomicrobiales]MBP1846462.1 hypothetical protein [Neorhizobium petrolearium]MDX4076171.1 hypothetical protein [Brucella sp. NBRC 113783]
MLFTTLDRAWLVARRGGALGNSFRGERLSIARRARDPLVPIVSTIS